MISPPAFDETEDIAPAFEETSEVQEAPAFEDTSEVQSGPDLAEKGKRVLAGAAEGTLDVAKGAVRLGQFLQPQLTAIADEVAKATGLATSEEFLTELEGAKARSQDEYGVDPKQNDKFLSTLSSAAGSSLPALASGPFAPYTTALQMGEQGYEEADQAGGAPGQKAVATVGNALTGFVTEKLLGVPALLKSAAKAKIPEKTFKALTGAIVKQMGLSFAREGTQETLEQISQDTIAKYIAAYDPERKIFDGKKLLTTFLAGGVLGVPVGALVQASKSLENIAPKEEMEAMASQVDQTLAETLQSQPPPLPDATTPVDLPQEQLSPTPETPKNISGTQKIVSTAIDTPQGLVTGKTWNASHQTMIEQALDKGVPFEEINDKLGFIAEDSEGNQRWVPRNEALEIARESGQVDESKLSKEKTSGLQSEALIDPVEEDRKAANKFLNRRIEKLQFYAEGGEVSSFSQSIADGLRDIRDRFYGQNRKDASTLFLQQSAEIAKQNNIPADQIQAIIRSEMGRMFGNDAAEMTRALFESVEPESKLPRLENEKETQKQKTTTGVLTADQAAEKIESYREAGIAMAKNSGATDVNAEDIFQETQSELSRQIAEGKTSPDKLGALVSRTVRNKTLSLLEKENAQKRGGGKVESGDVVSEKGTTTLEEVPQERGPRAETVSGEDVSSIEDAIKRLPESQSKVMQALVDNPGISDAELGKLTDLSEGAAKQAKMRARQTLKEFIRKQGIGERLGPGAANQKEFQKAQYLLASDMYEGLRQSGELSRSTWEKNMSREYEDAFSPEELDTAWAVAQEASEQYNEKEQRKPFPAIIAQLLGAKTGEGVTSIKNKQADLERRARGMPAAMEAARRTQVSVWDEAMRIMDENPQYQSRLLQKLRDDPRSTVSDLDLMVLLHKKIELENQYERSVQEVNKAEGEKELLEALSKAKEDEAKLTEVYDLAKAVGSEQGRAFAARRMLVSRDYSVARMAAELRSSQAGEELSPKQTKLIQEVSEGIQENESKLEQITNKLEEDQARQSAEKMFKDLEKEAQMEPQVKSLVDRILSRLDSAADKARARLKQKLAFVGSSPDPTIIYDLSVIGASKIAHGLVKFSTWSKNMLEEFGDGVKPYLKNAFDAANKRVDDAVNEFAPKNEKVKKALKNPTAQEAIDSEVEKVKEKLEGGSSLADIRSHVSRIALQFVKNGSRTLDTLVDNLHATLSPLLPGITKPQVMDLLSGYGYPAKPKAQDASRDTLRGLKSQATLSSKISAQDFSKATRKAPDLSKNPEAVRLLAEKARLEKKFSDAKYEAFKKTQNKVVRGLKEALNLPRSLKSSFDFSAVLRQGGFVAFGNPVRAAKNLGQMFKSFGSERAFENSEAEIRNRPNAGLYKASKLYLASIDGDLSGREEDFRAELADKIPGVKASNRAYVTFLNRMRADTFDALVGNLPFKPNVEQLKAISHYINVATGRGDLGSHANAAEFLSTVLWSPRLLISRMQLLVGEPLMRKNAAGVRKVIAKEYAKGLTGTAIVMALGALIGATIEKDPRSSDFGKLKFGNTRIDPWMGLQQISVLGSRLISGKTKTQSGQFLSLRKDKEDKKRPPFAETGADVIARFLRTKLTPVLGQVIDLASGENVVGEPVTAKTTAQNLLTPLSFSDILPIMKEHGIPEGTAMEILNLFGMSVQNYEDRKKK